MSEFWRLQLRYEIKDGKLIIGLSELDDQGDIDVSSIEILITDLLDAVKEKSPDDRG